MPSEPPPGERAGSGELVVETRPDPALGAAPVRFGRAGHLQAVEAILDCWPGADHRYFRVRVRDGSEYVLRHDLARDRWRVDVFRRDPSDSTRHDGGASSAR